MAESPTIIVRNASVVLVAPTPIEPQSIRPEALVNAEIIPAGWQLANNINTPVAAQVQYQNGIVIQTEGNRCVFQENSGSSLKPSYQIHTIAKRYVEATKLVPYNAIGINWMLDVGMNDSARWIRDTLLNEVGNFVDFFPTSLQMVKHLSFAACNLNFRSESSRLSVECNYHFPVPEGSSGVLNSLDSLSNCLSHLQEELLPRFLLSHS